MAYNFLMLNADSPVRTVQIEGRTWFNANDVFELLNLNPNKASAHYERIGPDNVSRFHPGNQSGSHRIISRDGLRILAADRPDILKAIGGNRTITSGFAILDVKNGRNQLFKHFRDRPTLGPCPEHMRVPVVIHGFIDGVFGRDDGVSREFTVEVTEVTCS